MTLQALRNKVAAGVTGEWTFEGLGDAEDLAHEAFHGSLDAAKALHDALLPGWAWTIQDNGEQILRPPNGHPREALGEPEIRTVGPRNNPARAWLLAILDALIEGEA